MKTFYVIIGMSIQAVITALLTELGLITPNPGQQFVAGLIFLVIAAGWATIKDNDKR